jgi:hypothetical protein
VIRDNAASLRITDFWFEWLAPSCWSAGVVPLILCLEVKLRFGRDIGRGSNPKFG